MAAMTPERQARIAELKAESTRSILGSTLSVKKASRFHLSEAAKAWIALIPALIFLILFMLYPILNTFLISFIENFTFMGGSGSSFALTNFFAALNNSRAAKPSFGFGNYINVLSDNMFLMSLGNTALMVIVSVPLTILISLVIAVLLNAIKPLRSFFQTVFFLPYVTNTIALGMVFRVIFSSSGGGLINSIFNGGAAHAWLTASANRWSMFLVIVVYAIWNGLAFKILVFQGGLASIDKQYYDAAKIDGASRGTIFRRVTVPLLAPEMLYITITSFIGAFKEYNSVIGLFGSKGGAFDGTTGPTSMQTMVYFVYDMIAKNKVQLASSAAVLLFVIILIFTGIQAKVSKKRVHY